MFIQENTFQIVVGQNGKHNNILYLLPHNDCCGMCNILQGL